MKETALELEKLLQTKSEYFWQERGDTFVLELFQSVAESVPAYKKLLKAKKVSSNSIRSLKDFKNLPTVDKKDFLKKDKLENFATNGNFKNQQWIFSATSGTTGEPFYFPRTKEQDLQYALTAELYLRKHFQIQNKSTLYVCGFAMGAWIGGLFTYQAIRHVAESGNYPISIITPGVNKAEIIKAITTLGPKFDQVIFGGYPPFVKDTLDEGETLGINWKKYRLKFVFSAEGFSEGFRDHVAKVAGLKNIYLDTLNHYGTVDLGTMSYETPICILIRRLTLKNPKLYKSVFGIPDRLPTLTQFLPEMFYFEETNGNILCSANSGLPLVRYDLKDRGGVISFEKMKSLFKERGLDLLKEVKKVGLEKTIWQLPFVYVYERSDLVVSWSGANIYPEHIKLAHQHKNISKFVSGKFTMEIKSDKKHDQYLEIHTELKKNLKPTKQIAEKIKKSVMDTLLKINSEYKSNHNAAPHKNIPKISLWQHESEPYFKLSGKQRWSKK